MPRPAIRPKKGKKPKKNNGKSAKWNKAGFDALVDFLTSKGIPTQAIEQKIGTAHNNRNRESIRKAMRGE